jgi:hypothetical protein
MVHNEAVLFPVWLKYYRQFFDPQDIYVLDHESTDGSTEVGGFVRVPVSREKVDWGWHRDVIQEQQHRLIARYDLVLCTDVDEIVALDPRLGTISDYIDRFDQEFVNCLGYEIIHVKDSEPALQLDSPILEQRSYWYYNPAYSKPLMSRVPMYWHGGLHCRVDGRTNPDRDLFLIHLHRVDYGICLARHHQRISRPWNQRDLDEGWGYQNRITDPDQFLHWFYGDSCAGVPIQIERIPGHWRGLI